MSDNKAKSSGSIRLGDTITGRDANGNKITGVFKSVIERTGPQFEVEGRQERSLVVELPSGAEGRIDRTKSGAFKLV